MREFELLKHIYEANQGLGGRVSIPPGDDMAMVRLDGTELLAAVDQLVDGRHFCLEGTSLELIGRKAVTRSLSDLAAMGGRPRAALVAVTLPPDFGADRAVRLFDAMRAVAAEFACPLIGGDIAFHHAAGQPLTCAVTVLGEPPSRGPITRGAAESGDDVYVTGELGGAVREDGSGRHLSFEPRVAAATDLVNALGHRLHAMIDLSDGLGRDASHIAEQSGVQIEIDARRLPCTAGVDWRAAVSDGEDYELLFTATGEVPSVLCDGLPVTAIGRVRSRGSQPSPRVLIRMNEEVLSGDELGWQHESE